MTKKILPVVSEVSTVVAAQVSPLPAAERSTLQLHTSSALPAGLSLDSLPTLKIQKWSDNIPRPNSIQCDYYSSDAEIGCGFSCKVLKGYMSHSGTITPVALRGDSLLEGSEFSQTEFDRSTEIWMPLSHSNIVKCYGLAQGNQRYQVLEYLPYQVNEGPSPRCEGDPEINEVYLSVTRHLRLLGINHTDLSTSKLEHFRYGVDGVIKVIDLGAATYLKP